MDDLDVMIDIHDQQKDIIGRFCRYAKHNLAHEKEKSQRFENQSKDLIYKLDNQLNELQRLRKWAASTAEAVSYTRLDGPISRHAQLTLTLL